MKKIRIHIPNKIIKIYQVFMDIFIYFIIL